MLDHQMAALFMSAAAFSTWDSGFLGAGVTLGADRRTATFTSAARQSTRGVKGIAGGKFYFESTLGGSSNWQVGVCSSSDFATQGIDTMTGGVGWIETGGVFVGGVSTATWGTYTAGNTISIAVDITNRLIWMRVAPSGNWNNSGAADPATGVGGLSFSGIIATMHPAASAQTAATATQRINTGQEPFVGARPSGFFIWE